VKAIRLALIIVVVLSAASAFARVWTDNQGNQVQGKFVRYFDGDVVILRGIKTLKIPFTDLCPEDREFVRKELEKTGQADVLPPEESEIEVKLSAPGADRNWTTDDGKIIRARLAAIAKEKVILLRQGREIVVPLKRLSLADQRYVEEQRKKHQEDAANPNKGSSGSARPPRSSGPSGSTRRPGWGGPPGSAAPPGWDGPPSVPGGAPKPEQTPPDVPPPTDEPPHQEPPPSGQPPRQEPPSYDNSPPSLRPPVRPSRPAEPPSSYSPMNPYPAIHDYFFTSTPRHDLSQASREQQTPSSSSSTSSVPSAGDTIGPFLLGAVINILVSTIVGGWLMMATVWLFNKLAGRETIPQPNFNIGAGICGTIVTVNVACQFILYLVATFGSISPMTGAALLLIYVAFMLFASVYVISSALPTTVWLAIVIMVLQAILWFFIGCVLVGAITGGLVTTQLLRH
jgi:hypothetical protein